MSRLTTTPITRNSSPLRVSQPIEHDNTLPNIAELISIKTLIPMAGYDGALLAEYVCHPPFLKKYKDVLVICLLKNSEQKTFVIPCNRGDFKHVSMITDELLSFAIYKHIGDNGTIITPLEYEDYKIAISDKIKNNLDEYNLALECFADIGE